MPDTNLAQLRMIAIDRYHKASGQVAVREAQALLDAIDRVAAFDATVGDWVACLHCPMAFQTGTEHWNHQWQVHRSR